MQNGQNISERTIDHNINYFWEYSQDDFKHIASHLQRAHPNFDLENLIHKIFEKTGKYTRVDHMHGRGDHGADIVLTSTPFSYIPYVSRCLVQIKSYLGCMTTEIENIKNAFDHIRSFIKNCFISSI